MEQLGVWKLKGVSNSLRANIYVALKEKKRFGEKNCSFSSLCFMHRSAKSDFIFCNISYALDFGPQVTSFVWHLAGDIKCRLYTGSKKPDNLVHRHITTPFLHFFCLNLMSKLIRKLGGRKKNKFFQKFYLFFFCLRPFHWP